MIFLSRSISISFLHISHHIKVKVPTHALCTLALYNKKCLKLVQAKPIWSGTPWCFTYLDWHTFTNKEGITSNSILSNILSIQQQTLTIRKSCILTNKKTGFVDKLDHTLYIYTHVYIEREICTHAKTNTFESCTLFH